MFDINAANNKALTLFEEVNFKLRLGSMPSDRGPFFKASLRHP